jgi:hypothetical protein
MSHRVKHHGGSDVVGKVRHEFPVPPIVQDGSDVDIHDVLESQIHIKSSGHLLEHRSEAAVDLISNDAGPGLGEGSSQRPGAGTSATVEAVRGRRSPTPISCSAGSIRKACWR